MKTIKDFIFSIPGKLLWLYTGVICLLLALVGALAFLGAHIPEVNIVSPWREMDFIVMFFSIIYFGGCAFTYLVTYIGSVGDADETN